MKKTAHDMGFTLLELLAVMTIMMIMTTVIVASYFNLTRGSGMTSSVNHLQSMLMFARQSAVINGRKTYVVFNQTSSNAWYVLCQAEGTITAADGTDIQDEYADWSNLGVGVPIYNLTTGEGTFIAGDLKEEEIDGVKIWGMRVEDPIFNTGDIYGWEIHPKTRLPRGYQFGPGTPPSDIPDPIVYRPEGTTDDTYAIKLYESIHSDVNDPHIEITVKKPAGFVSVEWD